MSDLVQIESWQPEERDQRVLSRRDVLRSIAVTATLGGLSPAAAQHVHTLAAEDKRSSSTGAYSPKAFSEHEYRTIQRLCDLIVPVEGNTPGALAAGAPEFIDLLSSENPELASIYTGGLAWIDRAMQRRHQTDFLSAKPTQQTELLDLIAYRKNNNTELRPGIRFFDWIRKMTIDAYFTSKVGVRDLNFLGNGALAEFKVPQEVMQYVLKRSPV